MVVCDVDAKVGGTYRFVWRGPGGQDMGMRGVYREVVRPERIVSTEAFDDPWYEGEAVGRAVFVEQGGKTTLTTTVLYACRGRFATLSSNPAWIAESPRATTSLLSCWPEPRLGANDEANDNPDHPFTPPGSADGVNLRSREESHMQKITPFLWFDGKAEEAMTFYISVFKNSQVVGVARYGEAGPGPKGTVMTAAFQLDGQDFVALNGGPQFKFTEAISFVVNCETQQEVDEMWGKLSKGGAEGQCGWLKDKYGVSWQIVPTILRKMLQDKDAEKAKRVMKAMLHMQKIDIARLKQASDQG
jgi:predicted 3-demethylubiquinone-9 3-methyltransferase (glyoxalase superfamily)